jgi:hypothetical protein
MIKYALLQVVALVHLVCDVSVRIIVPLFLLRRRQQLVQRYQLSTHGRFPLYKRHPARAAGGRIVVAAARERVALLANRMQLAVGSRYLGAEAGESVVAGRCALDKRAI